MSNLRKPPLLTQNWDGSSDTGRPTIVVNPYKISRISQTQKTPEHLAGRDAHLQTPQIQGNPYTVTHVSQTQKDPESQPIEKAKKVCVACNSDMDGDDPKLCSACIEAVSEDIGFGSNKDDRLHSDSTSTRPGAVYVELPPSPNQVEVFTIKSPGAVIREKFQAACESGQVIELHLSPKVPGQPQEVVDLTTPPSNAATATNDINNNYTSPNRQSATGTSNPQTGSPTQVRAGKKACITCGAPTLQNDRCLTCFRTDKGEKTTRGKHCHFCGSAVRESWMSLCDRCFRNSPAAKRRRFT